MFMKRMKRLFPATFPRKRDVKKREKDYILLIIGSLDILHAKTDYILQFSASSCNCRG